MRLKTGPAVLAVLVMAGCVSQRAALSFDQVRDRDWKLTELRIGDMRTGVVRDGPAALSGDEYTLVFQEDLALGQAAPNRYRSPYELGDDQALGFNHIAATLMAPLYPPEGIQEGDYFRYLERVYRWDLREGNLELYTATEEGDPAVLVYIQ
jgi:heat shock protein HslJ